MPWPIVLLTAVGTGVAGAALTPWARRLAATDSAWVSRRTPVLVAVLAGAGVATLASSWAELVAFALLAVACALLVAIDLAVYRLPDRIIGPTYVLFLGALTIASAVEGDFSRLGRAAAAAGIVTFAYFVLALISPSGIGLGDVKLSGLLGGFLGWLGWSEVVLGTLAAFALGGVLALLLLVTGAANRHSAFPFGPWMVAGTGVGAVWGAALVGG
ncbi:prepilin peptidase [Georgenia subflava]|uniref:Prepilin peptidase n=1 Tax=Georgenia subflava TaxID=1622177 RepID=A0A6N7EF34_9MICO|nr:prepilin peptidase [Georgenia subflava]MPV37022.1 prepilin peptidase [Georgenia subflava]